MLAAAAVTLAIAAVVGLSLPRTYTSTASVVLDSNRQSLAGIEQVLTSAPPGTTGVIETEAQVVKSRDLAERVVRRLRLDTVPEFNPAIASGGFGPRSTLAAIKRAILPPRPQPVSRDADPLSPVVSAVLENVSVARSGLAYSMNITATSRSPDLAAKIANAFAQEYIAQQAELKRRSTEDATAWLATKVRSLGEDVRRAEDNVSRYQVGANLLTSADNTPLAEQDVSALTSELATARSAQALAEARYSTARQLAASGALLDDPSFSQGSVVMHNLRTQKADASQRLADLSSRYKPTYPKVVQAREALDELDRQIDQETGRILASLAGAARGAQAQTAALQAEVNRATASLGEKNRAAVRLQALNREAASLRTAYEAVAGSEKQTAMQVGFPGSDARVISPATVPGDPSEPNELLFATVSLLLAAAAGLAAGGVAEMNDHAIRSADVLSARFGVNATEMLPLDPKAKTRGPMGPADQVAQMPMSRLAEAFRALAAVTFGAAGGAPRVLLITSALPGEGKTTTSLALARTLALANRTVVVVDCDFRRRGLTNGLGLAPEVGLREVLEGRAKMEACLVQDPASEAWILPISAGSADYVLDTDEFQILKRALSERFERVILDAPPVLAIADARVLASMADGALVLARWNVTTVDTVGQAIEALQSVAANVIGVTLTQVDLSRHARYSIATPGWYLPENRAYYAG
jgi:uncharacterized protein involved in exopolysaccharide biosynthesis/Mrp family chromosome partitioning ATPase